MRGQAGDRGGVLHGAVALAWVLREPNVASAIIGASRPEQVDDNAVASGLTIDPALFAQAEGDRRRYPARGGLNAASARPRTAPSRRSAAAAPVATVSAPNSPTSQGAAGPPDSADGAISWM